VLLELLAQMADVHVDRAGVAVRAVAPDRPQELLATERPARRGHERGQQLVLGERQADGLAADDDAAIARAQDDVADARPAAPIPRSGAGPAQHGADAAAQLGEAQGLDDVVVGASLQTRDDVALRPQGGEHDDRDRRVVLA
jgi:hypothetical protein